MPVYVCRVANDKGRIEELLREAASEEPLLRELSSRNLFVLSVKELVKGQTAPRTNRRFSRRVVYELTDLLALMLGSGLSLKDAIEVAQSVSNRGAGSELVTLLLEEEPERAARSPPRWRKPGEVSRPCIEEWYELGNGSGPSIRSLRGCPRICVMRKN